MYLATIELPIEANENVNYETWMENFLIANRISTHTCHIHDDEEKKRICVGCYGNIYWKKKSFKM